ncbi:helix-turn-helix transcriptional regulator [Schaalia canis]|uniref:WYL domain-containing protein n=1 Tax=Schaalia canis TaxID=100469 RepID=A0A3P1SGA0_9ACTO|nr:WYL domain-containing protein [Schaalia canis]RRC96178.1 WYL domain-containing protein [Schaalia canis]
MARNGGASTSTNIRALELFFALYESRKGMTRAELAREIPGYAGLDDKALQETQKRDFDALSAIGVRFDEEPDPDQRGRIRIAPDSVAPGTAIEFTGQQMTLIRMAFDAWEGNAVADPAVAETKLRASSEAEAPASSSSTVIGGIEGSPELSTILAAITRRQPITFTYTSSSGRMERGMDPWNLIIRGRSIYLWGWDHDRQDDRLFKLSRIEPPVELVGEAGDADPAPPSLTNPFDDFACEPLLWQRVGSTIPFLRECEVVADGHAPDGWKAVRGRREEWGVWAQRLISHGEDLIPREPVAFVRALREQLSIATKATMTQDGQNFAVVAKEEHAHA